MSFDLTPLAWVLLVAGLVIGYVIRYSVAGKKAKSVEETVKTKVEEARKEADELTTKAKEKALAIIADAQKEAKEDKEKVEKLEERVLRREENLEKQILATTQKEEKLASQTKEIEEESAKIKEVKEQAVAQLEKVAGFSAEEAKEKIFTEVEQRYKDDLVVSITKMERERREEIEKKASEIVTTAIMRYARTHVADTTTSVFPLPTEDLKGKIIGREGRNIKALERATGVEIIVDETPESVILSSFDPLRREIAYMTLEKLLKDGRIQPAKIEEKVDEAKAELIKRMQKIGEDAAAEVGVIGFPREIMQLLGRLHFRTSYGQNVLVHSIEMAHISGMIARELGVNVDIAKKGALVHDIGKAISHEVEGKHVDLGIKILEKYGVEAAVVDSMKSHHEDYPF